MKVHLLNPQGEKSIYELHQLNFEIQQGTLLPDQSLAWFEGAPDWLPLSQVPGIVIEAPPPPPPPLTHRANATETFIARIIPYKNPFALSSYYFGLFSLIPLIGVLPFIPALACGITGILRYRRNPAIKGSVHAWIGILSAILSLGVQALTVFSLISFWLASIDLQDSSF